MSPLLSFTKSIAQNNDKVVKDYFKKIY